MLKGHWQDPSWIADGNELVAAGVENCPIGRPNASAEGYDSDPLCLGGVNWTACRTGHWGVLCMACAVGDGPTPLYYKEKSGRCTLCKTDGIGVFYALAVVALLGGIAKVVKGKLDARAEAKKRKQKEAMGKYESDDEAGVELKEMNTTTGPASEVVADEKEGAADGKTSVASGRRKLSADAKAGIKKQLSIKERATAKFKETMGIYKGVAAEKVKIITTWMQIQSLFTNKDNIQTEYPPAYSQYVADASGWANLDLYSFFNIACSVQFSFLDTVLINLFVPTAVLAVLIILLVVFVFKDRKKRAAAKEAGEASPKESGMVATLMTAITIFTFLVFTNVCNQIFAVFNCRPMADGLEHLKGDLDVICGTPHHNFYVVIATVFLFIYPAGVPIGLGLVLYRARRSHSLFRDRNAPKEVKQDKDDDDEEEEDDEVIVGEKGGIPAKGMKHLHAM